MTPDGQPSGVVLPQMHLEYPGDDSTVVVFTAADGAEQWWIVRAMLAVGDMPQVVATDDGGALLRGYDGVNPDGPPPLLDDFRPDGSIDTFQLGFYRYAVQAEVAESKPGADLPSPVQEQSVELDG